jgi:hypothetical protein
MNIEKHKIQMRKVLSVYILSVLKGKDAYASEILGNLKRQIISWLRTLSTPTHPIKMTACLATVGKNQPQDHKEILGLLRMGYSFNRIKYLD